MTRDLPIPIGHVPYRPLVHRLLLPIPPWFCLTCFKPRDRNVKSERAAWLCRWGRLELKAHELGAVQAFMGWAVRESLWDLGMPEEDLRRRFFGWLVVPEDTRPLRIVPHQTQRPGAVGQGRPAAPARGRQPP